jgi:hypothetical protein
MNIEEEKVEKNNVRYRGGRKSGQRLHKRRLEIVVVIFVGGWGR